MSYKLFLDDIRPCPSGFIVARSYNKAVLLIENELPEFISFDHDLGEEKSGYDLAKYVVEYCIDKNIPIPRYKVHSANPVGAENIRKLLENYSEYFNKQK